MLTLLGQIFTLLVSIFKEYLAEAERKREAEQAYLVTETEFERLVTLSIEKMRKEGVEDSSHAGSVEDQMDHDTQVKK